MAANREMFWLHFWGGRSEAPHVGHLCLGLRSLPRDVTSLGSAAGEKTNTFRLQTLAGSGVCPPPGRSHLRGVTAGRWTTCNFFFLFFLWGVGGQHKNLRLYIDPAPEPGALRPRSPHAGPGAPEGAQASRNNGAHCRGHPARAITGASTWQVKDAHQETQIH